MGEHESYFAKRDRVELERLLKDIETGKIRLRDGQDEYVESLRQRIARIDGKLPTASSV